MSDLCYSGNCGDEGRCGIADHDWRMCPRQVDSARSAGIPIDVIMGKRTINVPPPEDSERYRQDMIDAGRGHLLRD